MATYDFVCKACDKEFELFVPGFLKEKDKRCPECGSADVRQKFSSFLKNIGAGGSCSPSSGSGFG